MVYRKGSATPPSGTSKSFARIYATHSSWLLKPIPHFVSIGPGGAFSSISRRAFPSGCSAWRSASAVATAVPASPFLSNAIYDKPPWAAIGGGCPAVRSRGGTYAVSAPEAADSISSANSSLQPCHCVTSEYWSFPVPTISRPDARRRAAHAACASRPHAKPPLVLPKPLRSARCAL